MSDAEWNYEIYDKEMLAIIRALQAWRQYLEGLPSQFQIANLKSSRITKTSSTGAQHKT